MLGDKIGANTDKSLFCVVFSAFMIFALRLINTYIVYFVNSDSIFMMAEKAMMLVLCISLGIFILKKYKGITSVKEFARAIIRDYFCWEHFLLLLVVGYMGVSYLVDAISAGHMIHSNGIIYNVIISTCVLFSFGRYIATRKSFISLSIIINAFLVGTTVLISVINVKLFLQIPMQTPNGGDIYMNANRLVINSNPNTVGAYSALITVICIIMAIRQKKWARCFYVCASVLHYIVLVLSNSRGAFVGFICAASAMAGAYFFYCSGVSIKKRIILSFGISAVALCCFLALRSIVTFSFDTVRTMLSEGEASIPSVDRDLELSYLSGRGDIWECAVKAMVSDVKTFFFGVTQGNINETIGIMSNGRFVMYTHNQILEVGLAIGVPGMLLFVGWLILVARDCWEISFKKNSLSIINRLIPFVVLYLVLSNMVEAIIFFKGRFTECIFMVICGWCVEKRRQIQILDK